jgi:hypothetical protein
MADGASYAAGLLKRSKSVTASENRMSWKVAPLFGIGFGLRQGVVRMPAIVMSFSSAQSCSCLSVAAS